MKSKRYNDLHHCSALSSLSSDWMAAFRERKRKQQVEQGSG
jgi:hypothetical protein